MSFLTTIEKPFTWIEGEAKTVIEALVPASLITEIGTFAHTFVANIVHDIGPEIKTLTSPMIEQVWNDMKAAAVSLAKMYTSGTASFSDIVSAGVTALKSEGATVVVPELKAISATTLQNWLPNLVTTSLAAMASANPPLALGSAPVNSPPVSSSAS